MAETRSAEEIRQSIEANRAELGLAVERLRGEVTRATDWRGQFQRHRKEVLIGAAVAGFVIGRRRRGDDRHAHAPPQVARVLGGPGVAGVRRPAAKAGAPP